MSQKPIYNELNSNDLLVFDVDGVLLDTSRSFPLAIQHAIAHYGRLHGFNDLSVPTLEQLKQFKSVPGFNNDWDLAEGAWLYVLQRTLFSIPVDPDSFLTVTQKYGSGIQGINGWLNSIDEKSAEIINEHFSSEQIRQLAQEHYAGVEYCEKLYGFKPEYFRDTGTVQHEKPLIDLSKLNKIPLQKGIYTGRNQKELEVALDLIGLTGIDESMRFYDDGKQIKPDPEPLYNLAKGSDAERVIFAGDSRDDYRTTENFTEKYSAPKIAFAQIGESAEKFNDKVLLYNTVNNLLDEVIEICEQSIEVE